MAAADPHTPVSNVPKQGAAGSTKKTALKEPSEGPNPRTNKVSPDGTEVVPGFKLPKEGAALEIAKAPDTSQLRDIGEASFGPPPSIPETVHLPDNRVRIANTSAYPWRAHASLLITAADNSQWIGTAWFIGPHTLATAGHNVYIKNSGVAGRDGWVRRILVMPGRDGDNLPYGSVLAARWNSVNGWINSGDENYDYGVIQLATNLGNTTGWFGFAAFTDATLTATVANISGYPGDKPSGTQWYDAHQIASVNQFKVYYDIDTYGGQSGSGVMRIQDNARYGLAVHTYGGTVTNSGTRINQAVYNNYVAWKA